MFDGDQKQQCQLCCCICGVISFIVLLALCFDTVEPTFFGLKCNTISKKCKADQVWGAGRHLVWPTNYFIEFPGALQTIEFKDGGINNQGPLVTRTFDGLSLTLHLSFQYKLIQEEIPSLYAMNNLEYQATFIRIARDTILQAAGNYNASYYWTGRREIGIEMQTQLDKELQNAHCNCAYLQILNIVLPEQYEDSIVVTQVEMQKKKMKEFEQQAAIITQQINVQRSLTTQEIKKINASAEAQAFQILQNATAKSNQMTIDSESNAYYITKEKLGLSEQELNEYIYYLSLMNKNSSELLVGMGTVVADARHD